MRKKKIFDHFCLQIPLLLMIAGSSLLITACNNGEKKGETSQPGDTTQTKEPGEKKLIETFKQYKLEIDVLKTLVKDHSTKKILLKISLDDLSDPTSMRLWLFPAKDHKDYARSKSAIEITPYGNGVVFTNTKDIIIGNNELSLKHLKERSEHTGRWFDFDYLLFTPIRSNNHLAFNVSGFKDNKIIAWALPLDTNPCPPAKPEDD